MKMVSAREFQKHFGEIAESLQARETIQVTKHAKVLGQFGNPPKQTILCPDFEAIINKMVKYPVEVSDRILTIQQFPVLRWLC